MERQDNNSNNRRDLHRQRARLNMRSYKRKYPVFASIAVIFLVFGVATADWWNDDDDDYRRRVDCAAKLPPGGNTLGAPGLWKSAAGNTDDVYDATNMNGAAPGSCITVANLSEQFIEVHCLPNGGSSTNPGDVDANDTRIYCCSTNTKWSLECPADDLRCKACYRVDEVRTLFQ